MFNFDYETSVLELFCYRKLKILYECFTYKLFSSHTSTFANIVPYHAYAVTLTP